MADHTAIQAVSSTLKTLLTDRMVNSDPVAVAPPYVTPSNVTGARVNLFLFKVTENASLKNQEIPGTGHPASFGLPPLSLDLHYLLTAFGASEEDDVGAQVLLGDAMRVLHDYAIITPGLKQIKDNQNPPVLDTKLQDEFERVKLCLEPINVPDIAEIWSTFNVPYRPSVAYKVSVVQIESQRPRRIPRLVGEPPDAGPKVHAVPFRSPYIREVRVRRQGDPMAKERPYAYARIGDTLLILGRNFAGATTRITLEEVDVTSLAQVQDVRIEVAIPDEGTIPQAIALQPGVRSIRVLKDLILRTPPEPSTSYDSNEAFFVLVPHVQSITPNLAVTPPTLTIDGTRLYHADLDSLTLIGDEVIPATKYTTATPTQIVFDLPSGLSPGDYAVRVRVNKAEGFDLHTLTIP